MEVRVTKQAVWYAFRIVSDSVPPSPTLEPGTVLDRYELLCTIARGGMAHVWLGRFKGKHGFERLVAVKTILPEHALDEKFRNMFLDEARIASGVEHPNVAQILDLGEWRESMYLVMEYVDGDSLSRLRRTVEKRNVKLPLPITLRILADVCAGLHVAHELHGSDGALLNVVHRDVSPQNILIPTNGVSKLIDFGVAKARLRLGEETSAGFAKGKSRYMAPEQALAKPIDRRADVFAVGAIAYEIFEGNAPYDGPNDMARLHALITGDEIRAVKHAPHPAVEKLIVKALARDPDQRFATANEMRAALEDAMVALKVRASADDVAAFVVANTLERIQERKNVVKVALDAATERARLKEVLEQDTISGRKSTSVSDASPASRSGPQLPPPPAVPNVSSEPAESAAPPAAYSASVHEEPAPELPRTRRKWAIVGAAGLGVALIFVIAIALRAHANAQSSTNASPSSPSSMASTSIAGAATAMNIPPPPPSASATMETAPPDTSALVVRPHATVRPHAAPSASSKRKNPHEVVIQ